MIRTALPVLRREALRNAFLVSVDQLYRRRVADIPDGYIDDYVALNWFEWHGGSLRVTPEGENVCQQLCPGRG